MLLDGSDMNLNAATTALYPDPC